MKNLINYYYGLEINNFKKINENYMFEFDNKFYEFVPFYGDISKFYKNYLIIINNNKYCHEVIFNNNKQLLTFYNEKMYILFKKNIYISQKVDLNEIINYNIPLHIHNEINWKKLWEEKNDYYEYQMSEFSAKYKLLKESFDYYIGLSENAIGLLNYVDTKKIKTYISHRRIKLNECVDEFFNPLNIIFDSRVRDIAEYLKINCFFYNFEIKEIINVLNNLNFDNDEAILFLSRMMYPTYYFDAYDDIIQGKISEEKINFFIKKNTHYEVFLKEIYNYIRLRYKIPQIDWLES